VTRPPVRRTPATSACGSSPTGRRRTLRTKPRRPCSSRQPSR
jgi:hypothetical protein